MANHPLSVWDETHHHNGFSNPNVDVITTTTSPSYRLLVRLLFDDGDAESDVPISTEDSDGSFTNQQQLYLCVIQRIAGAVSVLGGVYIFWRAWHRRHCAFDRIMLGLSIHTVLWGVYNLWGSAAVPEGTPNVVGAIGTETSCTIQGFLFQITMCVPFYYVFLSCYSWVVIIQGKFDPARYEWIEKYIHIGVHVFPVASAICLLKMDAFNPNGQICWIASIPAGCGKASGVECTKGPQDPETLVFRWAGLPSFFFLTFPTIAMVTLIGVVYQKGRNGSIPSLITAGMVAKQSALYLVTLYWVYVPLVIYYRSTSRTYGGVVWVSTMSVSLGLWFAAVYVYFSSSGKEPSAFSCDDMGCGGCDGDMHGNGMGKNHRSTDILTDTIELPECPVSSSHHEDDDLEQDQEGVLNDLGEDRAEKLNDIGCTHSSHSNGLSSHSFHRRDGSGKSIRNGSGKSITSKSLRGGSTRGRWSLNETHHSVNRERFSFNIFDGTASSGKFAAFVFDCDSDDSADLAETRHWEGCQNIISDR